MSKIGDYFASQCGNPHGIVGRILTRSMNRVNKLMYKGIINELNISDSTHILDIGFGNGYLEQLIIHKGNCHISGIDISDDMVKKATKLNKEYVDSGNMIFQTGDCCNMSFANKSFDIVATINTIYFWKDTMKGMTEIYRVLKDGGIFYNAVIAKDNLDKMFYTKNGFRKFEKNEYIETGNKAGFEDIRIKNLGNNYGLLIIYRKN